MSKNKITLSHIDHPNATRMAFFLNALSEEVKEIPFYWKEMKMADRITDACRFVSVSDQAPLTITVYFCDAYAEATEIAKANQLPYTPKARWSINGDLMYVVESEDEEKVTDVLGLFAGKE